MFRRTVRALLTRTPGTPVPAGAREPTAWSKASDTASAAFRDTRLPPVNEPVEQLRRRLLYQSRYRGMVEMDLLIGGFAEAKLPTLDEAGLRQFDALLREFDNDLFNWLVMRDPAPPAEVAASPVYAALAAFADEKAAEAKRTLTSSPAPAGVAAS